MDEVAPEACGPAGAEELLGPGRLPSTWTARSRRPPASARQGWDISYKGIWGYAPADGDAGQHGRGPVGWSTGRATRPRHTGRPHGTWTRRSTWSPPQRVRAGRPARATRTSRLTAELRHRGTAENVEFVFGMDNTTALRTRAEALEESSWRRLHATRPLHQRHRTDPRPPRGHQGGHRQRPGLQEPAPERRGRRRVRLHPRQVRPRLPG